MVTLTRWRRVLVLVIWNPNPLLGLLLVLLLAVVAFTRLTLRSYLFFLFLCRRTRDTLVMFLTFTTLVVGTAPLRMKIRVLFVPFSLVLPLLIILRRSIVKVAMILCTLISRRTKSLLERTFLRGGTLVTSVIMLRPLIHMKSGTLISFLILPTLLRKIMVVTMKKVLIPKKRRTLLFHLATLPFLTDRSLLKCICRLTSTLFLHIG